MKVIPFILIVCSFIILQSGGCSEEKILKQELTDEEIAILDAQPDCLKSLIANSYKNEGDLKNMKLVKSEVYGEVFYKLEMGEYDAFLTDKCYRVNKPVDGNEFVKNNEYLIGTDGKEFYDKFRGRGNKPQPKEEPKQVKKEEPVTNGNDQSHCINYKIEQFIKEHSSRPIASVYTYKSEEKLYYLFDEGMATDGPGYILSENCDTVCVTGGMRRGMVERPKCPQAEEGSQKLLWKKK